MLEICRKHTKIQELKSQHLEIESENNFATAAGMASSASGYACLATCFFELFQLGDERESEEKKSNMLAELARMGSGSACRSVFPGFVV